MHELSLCRAIIDTLQQSAIEHDFERVKVVRLEIGPLAAVDSEALRFAFNIATADTLAAGATLEIEAIDAGNAMRIKDLEVE